jgi:hypothetical protein
MQTQVGGAEGRVSMNSQGQGPWLSLWVSWGSYRGSYFEALACVLLSGEVAICIWTNHKDAAPQEISSITLEKVTLGSRTLPFLAASLAGLLDLISKHLCACIISTSLQPHRFYVHSLCPSIYRFVVYPPSL